MHWPKHTHTKKIKNRRSQKNELGVSHQRAMAMARARARARQLFRLMKNIVSQAESFFAVQQPKIRSSVNRQKQNTYGLLNSFPSSIPILIPISISISIPIPILIPISKPILIPTKAIS